MKAKVTKTGPVFPSSEMRRSFVKQLLMTVATIPVGLTLVGCANRGEGDTGDQDASRDVSQCDDLSKVSEVELKKRKSLGYTETSPIPENQCDNCNLYIPPVEGQKCGGCILFKGPVLEEGYCTYWAAQEADATI